MKLARVATFVVRSRLILEPHGVGSACVLISTENTPDRNIPSSSHSTGAMATTIDRYLVL
jgi:hypothetical protein